MNKYQWKSDFACKSCDKVFDSDQHLRQHMKCHKRMSNELIPCHHCDFITNDEDILLNHMANIHGTNHTCLTCKMAFTSENERIHHAGEAHGFKYSESKGSNQDIECHDCSDVFNNKFDLMQHKNKMHYKKRLCSYYHGTGWGCRYQSRCLNIHGESITPELSIDIRSRIQCRHGNECYYFYNNRCHYKHTPTHSMPLPSAPPFEPEEEIQMLPRVKCSQCSYETNTETERKYHIETAHGARPKDYRGIKATFYPVGHPQWAAQRNQTEHKCSECDSVFSIESMLNAHIDRDHNSNYPFTCTQCSSVFRFKKEVDDHVKKTHNTSSNVEASLNKISNQMDHFAQRLVMLEQSSLTNFPNLPLPAGRK